MKYRFKTEEEFKKELGENWQDTLSKSMYGEMNWKSPEMDYLFGTEFKNEFNDNLEFISVVDDYNRIWYISRFMITKCTPSYKPRKIIKEI